MFETGFPIAIRSSVAKVLSVISKKTYAGITSGYTTEPNNEEYELLDGSIISFPYRLYFVDDEKGYDNLDEEEQLIYDCIYTRSCDGYVREKHLMSVLNKDYPEWCMPYILRLSSEYIVEIVNDIYVSMKDLDNSLFMAFCENNPYMFRYMYARMTSYWNEYYRNDCNKFHDYVGYKLYRECFGYTKRFETLG